MKDLYKAIDNPNNIIAEEDANEKIDLKTGKYKGTNIKVSKFYNEKRKKSGEVPKDYKLFKTNPSAKP